MTTNERNWFSYYFNLDKNESYFKNCGWKKADVNNLWQDHNSESKHFGCQVRLSADGGQEGREYTGTHKGWTSTALVFGKNAMMRPSENSLMNNANFLPGNFTFNSISCGWMLKALKDTGIPVASEVEEFQPFGNLAFLSSSKHTIMEPYYEACETGSYKE